jgi:hypothetical protein
MDDVQDVLERIAGTRRSSEYWRTRPLDVVMGEVADVVGESLTLDQLKRSLQNGAVAPYGSLTWTCGD